VATTNKYLKGDLPIAISTSVPTALVRYQRSGFAANYAIGNTPWISAATDNNRISRITTTYQKERIDQGTAAGEQSLSNWWLRSATSWHHGAGERYYDADNSDTYRFYESNNIDIWTLGEAKLLPKTTQHTSVAAKNPVTVIGGTFYIANSTLYFYSQSLGTSTAITLPGTGNIPYCITSDGNYCIVAATDGIYDVTPAGVVRILWLKPTYVAATWTPQVISYVKERIVVAAVEGTVEVGVYEVTRAYTTPTPRLAAANERWETGDINTVVNSITELPGAIVVGYTQGSTSRIQSYSVDLADPLADLNYPVVIAELPRGETLKQMRIYLNEFIVLGTSKGLRVGVANTDGTSFTYGPLNVTGEVTDFAFDEAYIYACRSNLISGSSGLWRLNLGTEIGNAYAYAPDLVIDSSTPTGVAYVGTSGIKFITSSSGTWIQHPTELAASGYIKSGWIRWGTGEKKQPVSLAVSAGGTGTLGFTLEDQETQFVSFGSIPIDQSQELGLSGQVFPADHFEITFNFTRDASDATKGPLLESWQIRALPAPLRSRTITVPMLCYEEERDSNGVVNRSEPWDRVHYLERIEQYGGAVLFQDFSSGEERICVIRAIQFEQAAPPSFASGFGGIVTVQLQTIDTEQPVE
jgi:hypothetical protein